MKKYDKDKYARFFGTWFLILFLVHFVTSFVNALIYSLVAAIILNIVYQAGVEKERYWEDIRQKTECLKGKSSN